LFREPWPGNSVLSRQSGKNLKNPRNGKGNGKVNRGQFLF